MVSKSCYLMEYSRWSMETNVVFYTVNESCVLKPIFNVSGTVNIHPSLLPLYRGAAPVQRALQVKIVFNLNSFHSSCYWSTFYLLHAKNLDSSVHNNTWWLRQDGVPETGVSLAFTVRKLDAGPVIASKRFQVDDIIKVFTLSPTQLIILSYFLDLNDLCLNHLQAPELLSFLFSEGDILIMLFSKSHLNIIRF